jgi:secreted trypsin-like serine protease
MMVSLNSGQTGAENVRLTGSPGTGGAACFGDSGGPVLHGTTVVAVQSLGKDHCVGGSLGYRTDTVDSLNFINSFGP